MQKKKQELDQRPIVVQQLLKAGKQNIEALLYKNFKLITTITTYNTPQHPAA